MSRKDYYSEEQYEQDQYEEVEEAEQDWEEVIDEDDDAENDVKYVYRLIALLRTEMENARSVPLVAGRLVDAEKCLNILMDLEANLPEAIKRGNWAYEETSNMVRKAQEETRRHMASQEIQFQQRLEKHKQRMAQAEQEAAARASKCIADAEKRAKHMVSEGVIKSRVDDEVRQILNNAKVKAQETLLRVDNECYQRLDAMSVTMGKMLKDINRMRAEFEEE